MMSKGTKTAETDFITVWENDDFSTVEEIATHLELSPGYVYNRGVAIQEKLRAAGVKHNLRDLPKPVSKGNGKRGPKSISPEEAGALIARLHGEE